MIDQAALDTLLDTLEAMADEAESDDCEERASGIREAADRLREAMQTERPSIQARLGSHLINKYRAEWTKEAILDAGDVTDYSSLVALVEAKSGDRPTSALVIAKGESGLYSLLAFHPVTDLVMVVAANAVEFIMAAWEAHGCPATEEQAIGAGRAIAPGAKG